VSRILSSSGTWRRVLVGGGGGWIHRWKMMAEVQVQRISISELVLRRQ
jgi:hypothetical protein